MSEPFKMDLILQHSSVAHSANRDGRVGQGGDNRRKRQKKGLLMCVGHALGRGFCSMVVAVGGPMGCSVLL